MAESLQTGAHQLLIRFNCEVGEKIDGVRGVHIERRRFVVDDSGIIRGRMERRKEDLAAEVPLDALSKLIGEQNAALLDHAEKLRVGKERAEGEALALNRELQGLPQQLEAMKAERDAHRDQRALLGARVAELQSELRGHAARVAELERDLAAANERGPPDHVAHEADDSHV